MPNFFQKGYSTSPNGIKLQKSAGYVNAGAQALNLLNSAYGATNKVGNTLSSVGGVIGSIPTPYTAIAGAALGLAGGIANAFTDTVNQDYVDKIGGQISNLANTTSEAGDFSDLQQSYKDLSGSNIDLGDISNWGSKGIFSSGLKRERARNTAVNALEIAKQSALGNLNQQGRKINQANFANQYSQLLAFGGPITGAIDYANMMDYTALKRKQIDKGLQYAEGGGIHIKPSKRGTFTAAATKHGMGVQEFASKVLANKEDYSPAMVKKANFARNSRNWNAFGGDLMTNGATWDNGFTYIGNGGSHEANPNEGVQVGVDPQGIPNLVEEGEVIWNDYVFSKRLKVPRAFKAKYKFKDGGLLSFADAAKKFAEENKERPNDPISKRGRDALLTALMDQQEEVRLKKQQREARDQFNSLTPDEQLGIMQMAQQNTMPVGPEEYEMMSTYPNQEVMPEGQYAEGGELGNLFKGTGSKSNRMTRKYDLNWFKSRAKALGFDLGDNFVFNPTDYDLNLETFNELYKQHQRQKAYETYLKGQRSNWENKEFDSKRYKRSDDGKSIYKAKFYDDNDLGKDYIDINGNRISLEEYNRLLSDYNTINSNPNATTEEKAKAAEFIRKAYKNSPVVKGQFAKDYNGNIIYDYSQDVSNNWIPNNDVLGKNFKFNDSDALKISYDPNSKRSLLSTARYAPVIGSGIGVLTDALGITNTPDFSSAKALEKAAERASIPSLISATPIGNRLAYKPFDLNYYANQARSNAALTGRSIMNQSSGNIGATTAGLLALGQNTTTQMGDLFRKAEEYNLEQRAKVEDFNRATDMFNAQQDLTAARANQAEKRQAATSYTANIAQAEALRQRAQQYSDANRSANLTNFVNSLGQIGEEAYDQDRINALIERGILEDLYGIRNKRANRDSNQGANGGMLTKKKKRR